MGGKIAEQSRRALHLREPTSPRAPGDVAAQENAQQESLESVERPRKVPGPVRSAGQTV